MVPSRLQLPFTPADPGTSQTAMGGPPVRETFVSLPLEVNATDWKVDHGGGALEDGPAHGAHKLTSSFAPVLRYTAIATNSRAHVHGLITQG